MSLNRSERPNSDLGDGGDNRGFLFNGENVLRCNAGVASVRMIPLDINLWRLTGRFHHNNSVGFVSLTQCVEIMCQCISESRFEVSYLSRILVCDPFPGINCVSHPNSRRPRRIFRRKCRPRMAGRLLRSWAPACIHMDGKVVVRRPAGLMTEFCLILGRPNARGRRPSER